MVLPLEPTEVPGVYRRGSKFVVVYRAEGRQRKQSVDTLAEARVIKLQRDGAARAQRRGPGPAARPDAGRVQPVVA
jgi:hypothetical protein